MIDTEEPTMIAAGLNPAVVAGMADNSPQNIYKKIDQKETDNIVAQVFGMIGVIYKKAEK